MLRTATLLLLLAATAYGVPESGEIHTVDSDMVKKAADVGTAKVILAIQWTEEYLNDPNMNSSLSLSLRRPDTVMAADLSAAAEILEQSIAHLESNGASYGDLTNAQKEQLLALAGCVDPREGLDCSAPFHDKYRTIDGTCNHKNAPLVGASLTQLRRLADADYEDGTSLPRGWTKGRLYNGFPLPSPRFVSTEVVSTEVIREDNILSEMLMQWAQFLDHDMTFSPHTVVTMDMDTGQACDENCNNIQPCFPIETPINDHRIHQDECMGTTRSAGTCTNDPYIPYQREQFNQLTCYIDASNVYGSDQNKNDILRDEDGCSLKIGGFSPNLNGGALLPKDNISNTECLQAPGSPITEQVPCFLAGDNRVNEQLGLLAMHTIWMREHNRIVAQLKVLKPLADPEWIYQEARKIVGAMNQVISFNHFLPKVIGPEAGLALGRYEGFDENVDPSILNEFSTGAFRFGHGVVRPSIFRFNDNRTEIPEGHLELHKAFFVPWRMVKEGGVDPLIIGMTNLRAKKMAPKKMLNSQLTDHLFELSRHIAFDLAALNLQRGRDHGIPTYNDIRKKCGIKKALVWEDFDREIPLEVRNELELVYGHPDNVELWVGGMAEKRYKGGNVGRTFRCIMVNQFRALRNGDRFWYQNPGIFTSEQVTELEKASLARVLCDNGDNITQMQKDVFLFPDAASPNAALVPCNTLPEMDLSKWSD